MKQIFSFASAILFIACQNQPLSSDTMTLEQLKPTSHQVLVTEPELCQTLSEDNLDLVKELENKQLPGVYHRQPTLRSESDLNDAGNTFICQSSVTTSEDIQKASPSALKPLLVGESSAELNLKAEKWKILTQRWDLQPSISACADPSDSSNPTCDSPTEWDIADMMMIARN